MKDFWNLYSEKKISPSRLCQAVMNAFHITDKDVRFHSGSFDVAPPAQIYIEENDWILDSKDFRYNITLWIEEEHFKASDFPYKPTADPPEDGCVRDGENLAKKIVPFLQEPLVGKVEDYSKNDIYYYKCYPDGREERVEWPDEE